MRALHHNLISYRNIETILRNRMDLQPLEVESRSKLRGESMRKAKEGMTPLTKPEPADRRNGVEMYGETNSSTAQKAVIFLVEGALLGLSYWVLFAGVLRGVRAFGEAPLELRNLTLFAFNVVVFARFLLTLFVFLRRRIPWEETLSVPMAFGLYLLGFPLMAQPVSAPFGALEIVGIVLFIAGSFLNTFSEYERHRWKARAENRGKLYTRGLFASSLHVNYFGDLLWVTGYACVTHNAYAFLVPAFLFSFFYFWNVPKLDAYLKQRYGDDFSAYERRTKRLVPFVL